MQSVTHRAPLRIWHGARGEYAVMYLKAFLILIAICFGAFAQPIYADPPATKPADVKLVLVTKSFQVTITRSGEEGVVEDNAVTCHAVSKKPNVNVTLKGSTWHTHSPDGTPSRFLGYIFRNGDVTYQVLEEGHLTAIRGDKEVLVDEDGKWQTADRGN